MFTSRKFTFFTLSLILKISNLCSHSKKYQQTIFALSSGINTAISIVRVSGPQSYRVLELLQPKIHEPLSRQAMLSKYNIKPRQMKLKSIFGLTKGLIDRCLLVFFQAKYSYSGQDIFELHVHGSRAVVSALFQEFKRFRFRLAKRGQFTRRAVSNGLMNLQQAEAINDLVHSELQFQRQVAVGNMLGRSSSFLSEIRTQMIEALALIENYIQFDQNQQDQTVIVKSKQKVTKILQKLSKVITSSKSLQTAREGVKVSIVGRPNVGKSTLINALTRRDVAIVSPIPGTTRDLIESSIQLSGYKLRLVDTAGLRQSECPIEKEGIRRSRISAEESNITIVMLDLFTSNYTETEDSIIIEPHPQEAILLKSSNALIVLNKKDQLGEAQFKKKIVLDLKPAIEIQLSLSLLTQQGLDDLLQALTKHLNKSLKLYEGQSSEIFFTRARYLQGLERCCVQLQGCLLEPYADLMSGHLRHAMTAVEEMTGRVDCEQVLDSIFSTFCVGK